MDGRAWTSTWNGSADASGHGVHAGDSLSADVVIGAVGTRSVVRSAVADDRAVTPIGWATWQGLTRVPVDLANEHRALVHVAPDGCAVLISAGDGILQWSFDVPWRAGDARQLRKRAFLVSALAGNEHRLLHMARPPIRWFRAVALATWGYGTFLRTASNCL